MVAHLELLKAHSLMDAGYKGGILSEQLNGRRKSFPHSY
jgi:hypothetical protein